MNYNPLGKSQTSDQKVSEIRTRGSRWSYGIKICMEWLEFNIKRSFKPDFFVRVSFLFFGWLNFRQNRWFYLCFYWRIILAKWAGFSTKILFFSYFRAEKPPENFPHHYRNVKFDVESISDTYKVIWSLLSELRTKNIRKTSKIWKSQTSDLEWYQQPRQGL